MSNQSESIDQLAPALILAQKEIKKAHEDGENSFIKKKDKDGKEKYHTYASLNSVIKACKEALNNQDIWLGQPMADAPHPNQVCITTKLVHKSGQWMESRLVLDLKDTNPQTAGSTITYGRRYSLGAMLGVCTEEDDDGHKAGWHHELGLKQEPLLNEGRTGGHGVGVGQMVVWVALDPKSDDFKNNKEWLHKTKSFSWNLAGYEGKWSRTINKAERGPLIAEAASYGITLHESDL